MSERLSIGKAAKTVGVGREKVRRWVDAGKITAFRVGGTEAEPWLELDVEQLRKVKDQETVWIPPKLRESHRRRKLAVSSKLLHPLARLM